MAEQPHPRVPDPRPLVARWSGYMSLVSWRTFRVKRGFPPPSTPPKQRRPFPHQGAPRPLPLILLG